MIRYKFDYETATVKAVECETPGHPHKDADGVTQYVNTHFDTEVEAWQNLVVECEAGVSLGARDRARLRADLERATTTLADDAERVVRAKEGLKAAERKAGAA